MFIDRETGEVEQIKVPWPANTTAKQKHAGPGIATAPNGSIWMVQLETMGSMVSIDPETHTPVLYEIFPPAWARGIRFIHLSFSAASVPEHYNRIYVIVSTLLQDESSDALFILNMCPGWKECRGIRIIPLPSQQSACHRITYCDIEDGDDDCDDGSVFITELSKSKVLQIKMNADVVMTKLDEHVSTDEEGFVHRKYVMTDEIEFGQDGSVVEDCYDDSCN